MNRREKRLIRFYQNLPESMKDDFVMLLPDIQKIKLNNVMRLLVRNEIKNKGGM